MKKLGISRRALYEQLDRPALQPLPATRYVLAYWKHCRANMDYHIVVERHDYSVPFQLLREQVEVRYTTTTVEVFFKGRRVASHPRRYDGQPSTVAEHMPSAHRAHAEWTPSRLIRWAEKVGPATGELVTRILESRPHPEQGYKAVLGLMRLGRQHGNPRLDAASARAMALGSCRFHTVKNILAAGQDHLPLEPPAETAPTPTHANIRNADILVMPPGLPIAVTPRTFLPSDIGIITAWRGTGKTCNGPEGRHQVERSAWRGGPWRVKRPLAGVSVGVPRLRGAEPEGKVGLPASNGWRPPTHWTSRCPRQRVSTRRCGHIGPGAGHLDGARDVEQRGVSSVRRPVGQAPAVVSLPAGGRAGPAGGLHRRQGSRTIAWWLPWGSTNRESQPDYADIAW